MPQSNINLMYESIVADLAERAKMIMDEDGGTEDEYEAICQAIDEGFIHTSDNAYVIAHAFCNSNFNWGESPDWDSIWDDLTTDIAHELKNLRGED